jgi:hypothetical protein
MMAYNKPKLDAQFYCTVELCVTVFCETYMTSKKNLTKLNYTKPNQYPNLPSGIILT